MSTRVPWPTLIAASRPVVAWGTLLATAGTALVLAGLTVVLPAAVDSQLTAVAVLVLAVGLGSVADDDTAALTAATPVTTRRRLLARLVPAVLATAGVLAVVVLLAAGGGGAPDWGLVRAWTVLGALALAAGAVGSRLRVPGTVLATLLLGAGLVLASSLPESVLGLALWNSTGERLVLGSVVAAVALAWATRDAAARRPWDAAAGRVRRGCGRRPVRPPAAACR